MTSILLLASFFLQAFLTAEEDFYALSSEDFFKLEQVNQQIKPKDLNRALLEAAIFHATNEVRKAAGKDAFGYDIVLNEAARLHAGYLQKSGKVEHLNKKNKKWRTPMDRATSLGGDFTALAENLARVPMLQLGANGEFYISPEGEALDKNHQKLKGLTYAELARKTLNGWMQSPGHRKNILKDFQLLGTGASEVVYSTGQVPEVNLVQNFANP